MNATITTVGRAYTSDTDYNEFLGAQYERIIYDWTIRQWRRCTMQAPKTPQDSVQAGDADAELVAERLPRDPKADARIYAARVQAGERRNEAARENIVAYLRVHGPQHFSKLLPLTEWTTYEVLRQHFNAHPDIYKSFRTPRGVWGLVGQELQREKKTPVLPRVAAAIRAALLHHGPHASRDLMQLTGMRRNLIDKTIKRHPGAFVGVDKDGRSVVWGVRGIHDQEEA